ncbi:MAG TPA: hypothetical protein VG456_13695 [Candidatus Sulfopaludibacter sp.]|jgi:hypothetical protein|nr:hypothetical protein [Candidatus Sulfopaludibacter sp.]
MRLLHIGFALILATAGYADIITLKTGRVINGTYLGGSPREVKVEVGDQIETFETSQVAKIEFGNGTTSAGPDRNRPVLRRADSQDSSDEARPTLRRDPSYGSSDSRPTLRRDTSASSDDGPPTLRRSSNSTGDAPTVLRPGDTGPGAASTPASVAAARQPVEIPSGTNLVVRIIDPVDSEKATTGQTYRASIDQPITAGGDVVIPRGADVLMKLVESKEAGKLTGRAELTLALVSVTVDGRVIDINTQNITQESDARGKRTATKAGGGAVLGAIIGGLAGGAGGAAAGAGAGAAAGTGVEAISKGPKVKIPSETRLTFVLDNPVTI